MRDRRATLQLPNTLALGYKIIKFTRMDNLEIVGVARLVKNQK